MSRHIYRGRKADGVWVEGFYSAGYGLDALERHLILVNEDVWHPEHNQYVTRSIGYNVDPATVGQSTGRTDKNGKEAFENDLLKSIVTGTDKYQIHPIIWDEVLLCYTVDGFPLVSIEEGEIIGNIHDTPSLLEDTPTRTSSDCEQMIEDVKKLNTPEDTP